MGASTRNGSEGRFYKLLLQCGIPPEAITEPDKCGEYTKPEPDFLINEVSLAIEVKHFEDRVLQEEDRRHLSDLRSGEGAVSFFIPIKNKTFLEHIKDAKDKFKNYPGHSTLLVEDMFDNHFLIPDKEYLLGGLLAIHLNKDTGEVIKYSNQDRSLRVDRGCDIGAICFVEKDGVSVFHNIMAHGQRKLPYHFWSKRLGGVEFKQYVFFNPPGDLCHIYALEHANR